MPVVNRLTSSVLAHPAERSHCRVRVNFTALPSRLINTWRTLPASARTNRGT